MTWSYSGAPKVVSRDAIRFLVGQTSSQDAVLLQDEEIDYLSSLYPDNYIAAAECAEQIAGRYAGKAVSKRVGDLAITYADRQNKYLERARELRHTAATRSVTPFAGGTSVADMNTRNTDPDRVQTSFAVGFDERSFT